MAIDLRPLPELRAASRLIARVLDAEGPAALAGSVAAENRAIRALGRLPPGDEAAFMRRVRQACQRQRARLAARDFSGAALDDTLHGLSDCADAAAAAALAFAVRAATARHGAPRHGRRLVRPVIVGMGKLGGRELNASSDIDLIGAHDADGRTPDGTTAGEWCGRVFQHVSRLLSTVTADGFAWRVDWMLRPWGSAGALSQSFGALEQYYQGHGREWERYAWIKARVVAGDAAAGARLLETLRPFVYRRYMDHGALKGLRELKGKIEADAARHDPERNVKLGPGGIRDIEFVVQSFQLVRGGQDARLRDARLRPVLARLGAIGLLPADEARRLDAAYVFLRRLENALQFFDDAQTHRLPAATDPEARAALAVALDLPSFEAVRAEFARVRAFVHEVFRAVFAPTPRVPDDGAEPGAPAVEVSPGGPANKALSPPDGPAAPPTGPVGRAFRAGWDIRAWTADDVAALGFTAAAAATRDTLAAALTAFRNARLVRLMREDAQGRLRSVTLALLRTCLAAGPDASPGPAGLAPPAETARRVLDVLTAIAGRMPYLWLLHDSPAARARLVAVCAASRWMATELARTPALLDLLLGEDFAAPPPAAASLRASLAARADGLADEEARLDALRRFVAEQRFHAAAASRLGGLPLPKVSDHLTFTAEAALAQAVAWATGDLEARHGWPRGIAADVGPAAPAPAGRGGAPAARRDAPPTRAPFAVIAYGKFGALEMGFGSDLDLVFLHGAANSAAETAGPKPLAAGTFFGRLAQRVAHYLQVQAFAGRAYEVDVALRPDGRAGLPCVSLAAFATYQDQAAWVWEHQALTRARAIGVATAGDRGAALAARFEAVRGHVLGQPRPRPRLAAEVAAMRRKMRTHRDHPGADWDIKQGEGGLTDIEFMAQFLVLAHAHRHPGLAACPDVWRQLDAAVAAGVLPRPEADALLAAQRAYRQRLHAAALQEAPGTAAADDPEITEHRTAVQALWRKLLPEPAGEVTSGPAWRVLTLATPP